LKKASKIAIMKERLSSPLATRKISISIVNNVPAKLLSFPEDEHNFVLDPHIYLVIKPGNTTPEVLQGTCRWPVLVT
jgi:hypothetical protein